MPIKSILCSLTCWFLLLVLTTGCRERNSAEEEEPEFYCEVGVQVEWGEIEKLPEGVEILFYPQETGGKPIMNFMPPQGGTLRLKPGSYKVVLFNYDTEAVQVRGSDRWETLEAYTGFCSASMGSNTKGMVWEPDLLYVTQTEITIGESELTKTLQVKPRLIPKTCSFEIKAEGLEYINAVSGSISGMAASYFMGSGCCSTDSCTIYFEMQKGDNVLKGKFCYFGVLASGSRADFSVSQLITVTLMKRDGSVQRTKIDVTEAIRKAEESSGGEDPGDNPGENPGGGGSIGGGSIEIPIEEEIEIPYVPSPPSEGGGGIGGDVGDWEDEPEIVIPLG